MGPPRLKAAQIPYTGGEDTAAATIPGAEAYGSAGLVNMGNPHAVFFVADLARVDLAMAGPPLETHPLFPQKANISFAQILAPDRIKLKVWERGVGATLACGSAACATLVAAARRNLSARRAAVELPGGTLEIDWRAADGHVLMTGPVEFEREIELTASMFS
jgi:diaminopimelate epimerase